MLKHICPTDSVCKKCKRNERLRKRYATDETYRTHRRQDSLQRITVDAPPTETQKEQNRQLARDRYNRLKNDPDYKAKLAIRDKKRFSHTCPDVLPCNPCEINQRNRDKRAKERRYKAKFPVYKKTSRLYWQMAVSLLADRDGWFCYLCHILMTWETVTIDHVNPQCIEPANHQPTNLRLAHRACNSRKGAQAIPP
jgi:5-methylcytosine-specific restriction endonuclease McrA